MQAFECAAPPYSHGFQPSTFMVVGCQGLNLSEEYDPNQYWLSFMEGAVFRVAKAAPVAERPNKGVSVKNRRLLRPLMFPGDLAKRMYHSVNGLPQMELPFFEHRQASANDFHSLELNGFPGWDRHPDGSILVIVFDKSSSTELRDWAHRCCVGRFHITNSMAYFQRANDYVYAKIGYQRGG